MTTASSTAMFMWPPWHKTSNQHQNLILTATETILGLPKRWFLVDFATFRIFEFGPAVPEIQHFEDLGVNYDHCFLYRDVYVAPLA